MFFEWFHSGAIINLQTCTIGELLSQTMTRFYYYYNEFKTTSQKSQTILFKVGKDTEVIF
jgi:hypothetical protein